MSGGRGAASAAPLAVTVTLADGTALAAPLDLWREYCCPFCSYVVPSPEGHEERQRLAREYAEVSGETFVARPYPDWEREAYEAGGCGNPACLVNMTAARLAAHREEQAVREAGQARRAEVSRWSTNYRAEKQAEEAAAWQAIAGQAQAAGQCLSCLRASYWQTRPHLVKHRPGTVCPHRGRWAA